MDYEYYGLTLTNNQISKLKNAVKSRNEVTLRISRKNLSGNIQLPLTKTQINKINKSTNGVQLKLSKKQLSYIKVDEKTGGFLPLLSLIPIIAGAVGAAGGLTGGIASAVSAAKSNAEQKRHNKTVEDILQKEGSGIVSNIIEEPTPINGRSLSDVLKKFGLGGCVKNLKGVKWGNGIYLERQGSGVFLERQREEQ